MTNVRRIVVHGGQAHRDDFIASCIALATYPSIRLIERRDPTPDEMEDPTILVLDVGGKLEPLKNNFDHHQMGRDEPACCALSLLLADLQLIERFRLLDWFTATEIMDSKGPMALAKHLGCPPAAIFGNLSPIEGAVIDMFEDESRIEVCEGGEDFLAVLMRDLGRGFISYANELHAQMEWLIANAKLSEIGPVPCMILESANTKGVQKYRDHFCPGVGISICWDDRGAGWALYRFNDHPQVDFFLLKDDPRIEFAHPGGFIAKTKGRLSLSEVCELAMGAIIRK